MCLNTTYDCVLQWAEDRNLIKGSTPNKQFIKLLEEVEELQVNLIHGTSPKDDIGDIMVVLTIIAAQNGLTLSECYSHAYEEIKDRKGKMVDGIFVKEV